MEDNNDINIQNNIKILNCIIDICESHPPRYNHLRIENESFIRDDYFSKPLEKHFTLKDIFSYKGKEQHIHEYKQFENNNLFYKSLLEDFKLYMSAILFRKKRLVLVYPDNDNLNQSLFNNNISFIYFYNFILFLKDISIKFPKIINESIYKIDLILIVSIFSPNYKISFENGVEDKYGINYETYTILMIELIDLIKKKYDTFYNKGEIENYEYKYPENWDFYINQIELKIINFFFFKDYIIKERNDDSILNSYLINKKEETDSNEYFNQIGKIYKKFKAEKKTNFDDINKNLDIVIKDIIKEKSFQGKKNVIKEILENINNNDNYKLLNNYNLLSNLGTLYEFYSLNKNEIQLQLIYCFDLMDKLEEIKYLSQFKISFFLKYILNRRKIIQELKTAKDYSKDFRDILESKEFRNKIKIILQSPVVINYYKNPKYYSKNKSIIIKYIKDKEFIEIYESFLKNFIDNDLLYERIISKRMPYGIKGAVTTYLCFILDPYGIDINNNTQNKKDYLETYLIILILHETNHFSKRSYYMNQPLSYCKTPNNYEGGDSIIHSIFSEEKICIINSELCKEVNNLNNWLAETKESIKKFKKTIKSIITNLDLDNTDEEKLTKMKNEQNCLISFANYKNSSKKEPKIIYIGTNSGFFRF